MNVALDRAAVSYIAKVPATAVDRAIDRRRIVPSRRRVAGAQRAKRELSPQDAFILAADVKLAGTFGEKARQALRRYLADLLRNVPITDVGVAQIDPAELPTSVDLGPLAREFAQRLEGWLAAHRLITEDPEIQGGSPTFKGTRVLVRTVAAALDAGIDPRELREDYDLTDEQLEAARVYVAAHPARGRPRRRQAPGRA